MEPGLPGSTCRRKRSTARAGRAMVAAAVGRHRERLEAGERLRSVPAGPALGAKTSRGKEATKRPGQGGENQLSSVIKAK